MDPCGGGTGTIVIWGKTPKTRFIFAPRTFSEIRSYSCMEVHLIHKNNPRLILVSPSTTTRGHQFKLLPSHCNLDVRRRSFAERVVNPWNSLSVQAVSSDNINTFKRLLQVVVDLGQSLFDYR